VYVVVVAPAIGLQPFPWESQRCHWSANVGAGTPLHVPTDAVTVEPGPTAPLIEGGVVFAGTDVTMELCAEVADAVPATLVATTCTRSVEPTSADWIVYAAVVAPAIAVQPFPWKSQRCHWNANVGTGTPLHAPTDPANGDPTATVPVIEGGVTFAGAVATTPVAGEVAEAVPAALVALTRTRRVVPASAGCTT
jgi:hypothetical protein